MPTRTELIPCGACGVPRPVTVKGPSDIITASESAYCRNCRTRFTPYTANVPCPQCHTERPLRITKAGELLRATERICRECVRTNTDEMAVARLILGQPVKANAAERNQAVATLAGRKLTNSAIAERIGCTTRTVERHRARLAS